MGRKDVGEEGMDIGYRRISPRVWGLLIEDLDLKRENMGMLFRSLDVEGWFALLVVEKKWGIFLY